MFKHLFVYDSLLLEVLGGTFMNVDHIDVKIVVLVALNIKVHGWFMYSAAAILVIQWKVSKRLK